MKCIYCNEGDMVHVDDDGGLYSRNGWNYSICPKCLSGVSYNDKLENQEWNVKGGTKYIDRLLIRCKYKFENGVLFNTDNPILPEKRHSFKCTITYTATDNVVVQANDLREAENLATIYAESKGVKIDMIESEILEDGCHE